MLCRLCTADSCDLPLVQHLGETNLLPSMVGYQYDLSPGIHLSLSSALDHSIIGPALAQGHSVNYREKGTRSLEACLK